MHLLHPPADIAYILEALPLDERLIVWDCVRSGRDGEILVEVNEGVRETLIDAMNRDELVDAVESLDTDEIADLVEDLPPRRSSDLQNNFLHNLSFSVLTKLNGVVYIVILFTQKEKKKIVAPI